MHLRDLFWQLTYKGIKARYKQSVLGYAWAILVPLLNLLVLTIVFSYVFRVQTGDIPYPIFLFVALVPWIFFSNSITAATGSIMDNSALITKVKLPREIIPISAIGSKMIDLMLTFLVLLLFLYLYKIEPYQTIFFVPLIFAIQLVFMVGVAFFLSATNVFFRDVSNVLGVFLTIWMYLTPVVYSTQMIPDNLKPFFYLNPMTSIINSYRDVILYGRNPNVLEIGYILLISLVVLVGGYIYFRKRAKLFADVI